jgi:hypothetical protein
MQELIDLNRKALNDLNLKITSIQATVVNLVSFWDRFEQDVIPKLAETAANPAAALAAQAAQAPTQTAIASKATAMNTAITEMVAALRPSAVKPAIPAQAPVAAAPQVAPPPPAEEVIPVLTQVEYALERARYSFEDMARQLISPEAFYNGRGEVAPKKDTRFSAYAADLNRTPLASLQAWPTGFYRDEATSARQLFVAGNTYLFIFPNTMSEVFEVIFIERATGNQLLYKETSSELLIALANHLHETIMATLAAQ